MLNVFQGRTYSLNTEITLPYTEGAVNVDEWKVV